MGGACHVKRTCMTYLLPCIRQNPDPKAHKFFAEYITKAYQALTDEVSRQNYEKYGHPDGPQVGGGWVGHTVWDISSDQMLPLKIMPCYETCILDHSLLWFWRSL